MYQKGVTMKKLSKELIKNLIYEALRYNQTTKELTVLGDDGEVIDTHKDFPEEKIKDKYPDQKVKLTTESIDRIIREEVSRYYGAK